MAYCNTTTDLLDCYPYLERFQGKITLEGFVLAAGQTNTYAVYGCGQIELVFDNGVPLTEKTSVALVEATAATWWYDDNNDVVYVHATDNDNLITVAQTTTLIEAGQDWDTLKTTMRNNAQQFVDSILNTRYPTPLMPRLIKTHNTQDYEYPVVRATALLTCAFLIRRRNPEDATAMALYKEAYNSNPEPGETKGILNQLKDGDIVLQEQISGREVGGFNVYPYASNTATAYVWFIGTYSGRMYERWRLAIDTAGAVSTATWKVSRDGGSNYDLTLQSTFDVTNDDRRIYILDGIYAVFYGTFAVTDYWDIEVFPLSDTASFSKLGSAELSR
jgi:hypothetical protein